MEELIANGFLIYLNNGKFVVKKDAVTGNPLIYDESYHEDFASALKFANDLLNLPKNLKWNAIIRYNRGLGVEYRNISEILASDYKSACENAEKEAVNLLGKEAKILEIKVKITI